MAKRCFYEVLGVSRTVTEVELKGAFRKGAMQHHPDRNPGDKAAEVKFKEVNEAYQILSDGQKRAAYDRFGHAAFEQGGGGGAGMGPDGFASSMADIFEDLFGGLGGQRGRGAGGRERGSDLRYNLEIALEDAFRGKAASIKAQTAVACEACSGSGAKPGSKPKTCGTCHGHGRVRAQQGFFAVERTCPTCQGRGSVVENPCAICQGQGRVTRERALSVNIPPGVEDGTRIRLAGEGEAGLQGGAAGDLYIFLSIKPHPFFQREGADLYCQAPISMAQAALGGEFVIRTIDGGEETVRVPEGAQSGHQFKLRGKGMPILRSRDFGGLYIQARVETPQNLTRRQRELSSRSSPPNRPTRRSRRRRGFFARMKEFFDNIGGTVSAPPFLDDRVPKLRNVNRRFAGLSARGRTGFLRLEPKRRGRRPALAPGLQASKSDSATRRGSSRLGLKIPSLTGAVSPSGRFLARARWRAPSIRADAGRSSSSAPARGRSPRRSWSAAIAPERLVLVEFDEAFCRLLARRFPRCVVVRGDAYHLRRTLDGRDGRARRAPSCRACRC